MLVNGSPTRLFKASRCPRQRDPLSPFRFTIVVEALSAPFCKAKEGGINDGFDVGSGVEPITHLSFADDTILLSSTRWEEIEVFERILRCFAFVSG